MALFIIASTPRQYGITIASSKTLSFVLIISLFLLFPCLVYQHVAAAESHPSLEFRFNGTSRRVNFDVCTASDQCLPPRRCISLLAPNCHALGPCFCYARLRCSSTENSTCAENEVCYRGLCESAARHFHDFPSDEAKESVTGQSFETCTTNRDCKPNYQCIAFFSKDVKVACPGDGSIECRCFSAESFCLSSSQCSPHEFCFRPLGIERAICLSRESFQLFEPSSDTPTQDGRDGTLFNFETCNRTSDCAPPRECIRAINGTNVVCDEDHEQCVCLSNTFMCQVNSFCDHGETCVFHQGLSSAVCKATTLVEQHDDVHAGTRLSLQKCSHTKECRAPRRCARFTEMGLFDECHEKEDCFCLDTEYHCFRDECFENESCEMFDNSAACAARSVVALNSIPQREKKKNKEDEMASEDSVGSLVPIDLPPDPSLDVFEEPSNGGACVAVKHLGTLERNELLFATHRTMKVLCDEKLNCATAGHIVVYRGIPLSMKRYCRQKGCSTKIMKVNSPRYVRGLRIISYSEELEMTTFSARFETSVEEALLVGLVWIGL